MHSITFRSLPVGASPVTLVAMHPSTGPSMRLDSWNVSFDSTSAVDQPVLIEIGLCDYNGYGTPITIANRADSNNPPSYGLGLVGIYGVEPTFLVRETYEVSARFGHTLTYPGGGLRLPGSFGYAFAMRATSPTSVLNASGQFRLSVE